ncbi:MAG: hypothetical protein V3U92_15950 [Cellulophaga sp.]
MKAILLITVFLIFSFNDTIDKNQVYICKGKASKRYHLTKSCRGLSRCSSKIEKVTLTKAKKLKKTLCKWED